MAGFTKAAVFLACAIVLGPAGSRAAVEADFTVRTTGDLVRLCDPTSNDAMANAGINFCHGYVQGAVGVEMQHEAASRSMKLFCLPSPPPSRNEAIAAFVKWAKSAAQRQDGPPADAIFRYLGERYPCPGGT